METGELKGNGQVSRGLPNQPQPLSKQWLAGRTPQPNVPQPPTRVTSHNHLTGQIPGRGGGADDGWARLAGYSLHFVTCGPRTCGLKVLKGWRPCLGQLESQYSVYYWESYVVEPRGFAISGQGLRSPGMIDGEVHDRLWFGPFGRGKR
jgi:hypothetical protein